MTRRRAVALAAIGVAADRLASAARHDRVRLERVPHGGIQPQIAMDDRGTVHMVYFTGEARGGDLSYVRSKDGGLTWSRALAVNERGSAIAAGTIRGAQLALGRDGSVHVAWNGSQQAKLRGPLNPDSGKPGEPMLYTRLNDSSTAFELERNLMTRTFGLDGGGSVTADAKGNVWVAWHGIHGDEAQGGTAGEARRRVWLARSRDNGRTFSAEAKAWSEPTGACGCCGMKVFADAKGGLSALYRSAREQVHRDIYLLGSKDGGGSFQGRLLHEWNVNACPMSSMDFTERTGEVVAAWETGGQVYWAPVDGHAAPVAAPGEGKGRKHPRLASNANGELLMVWAEGTGWQRGGSLAWQLYDREGRTLNEKGTVAGVPVWSFGTPAAMSDGRFTIFY